MSQLDREGLISQSNALFPDNTAQEITPTDIRQFDLDVIDSFALTGSLVVSASYAISSSHSDNSDNAISASYATTASFALNVTPIDTGSLLTTASVSDATITFTKADSSTFDITVDNVANAVSASHALFSEEAENALHADAVQFPVIAKETLSKGDPVYVSGYNDGEGKPQVLKADASDSSKMPVVGLAMVDAVNNDHIFIISAGSFPNVDTDTGLTTPAIGDTLYVASGGGYTNVKPTGTNLIQNIGVIGRVQQNNGEIVVSAIQRTNDLPNIQDGYLWVGDTNGVPQAVASSSIQTDTSNLATTGSNTFNGSQIISGSVTVSDPSSTAFIVQSGPNDTTPVIIEGGFNGTTKFTDSSIRGVATYGGNTLSGSFGKVGLESGYGVLNANTGSSNSAKVYLGNATPAGGIYRSFESIGASGLTNLRGDTIKVQGSGSLTSGVSMTVYGDVTASGTISYGTSVLNNSSNIISGSTTFQDVNPAPGATLSVRAGGASPVLEINNSALGTLTGTDYILNGNSIVNGNSTINGNTTQNGNLLVSGTLYAQDASGAGPINIFDVDNTTNTIIGVSNPALAGITGNEIINNIQYGDFMVTNASGSRIKVYEQSRGTAAGRDVEINGSTLIGGANSDVTISAGTSGRTLLLSGSNVTLTSGTPMQINSAVTFNGAMLINAAIYQGQDTLGFPSSSISNLYDYFFVPLTPFTTAVNVDSLLGQGRTVNLLVEQTSGTGLIELQYSGGPAGTTQLFGPSAAVSGSFLTPSTTPGSYTSFELKAYNKGGTPSNIIVVTSYEPNLVIGDITKWQ